MLNFAIWAFIVFVINLIVTAWGVATREENDGVLSQGNCGRIKKLKASPTSEFRLCEEAFGSCPFCLTDYRIDILWQGAKKGHVIKLFVYRQLGDYRSPFE